MDDDSSMSEYKIIAKRYRSKQEFIKSFAFPKYSVHCAGICPSTNN